MLVQRSSFYPATMSLVEPNFDIYISNIDFMVLNVITL